MSEAGFRERLASRCASARVSVPEDAVKSLWLYYEILSRWNRRINLTALPLQDCPSATIDRLLVEPLLAASALPGGGGSWVDLGSGGGSPAIPLKIVRPDFELTMTESRGRKAAFLREAVRVIGLRGSDVLADRFETLASRAPGTFSLITARAVRIDQALTALASHLLAPGGRLVLFGTNVPDTPAGFAPTAESQVLCRSGGFAIFERQ